MSSASWHQIWLSVLNPATEKERAKELASVRKRLHSVLCLSENSLLSLVPSPVFESEVCLLNYFEKLLHLQNIVSRIKCFLRLDFSNNCHKWSVKHFPFYTELWQLSRTILHSLSPSINVSHIFLECPEAFVRNIYEQQCYMLVQDKLDWYQAEEYCHSKNAYLAELIEPEERDAVWNYIKGNISEYLETQNIFCLVSKVSIPTSNFSI